MLISVDSTQIGANASPVRAVSGDQLVKIAKVNRTVREYVEQVERENAVMEADQTSETAATEENERPKLSRTYRNWPPCKISTTDQIQPCPASEERQSSPITTVI